MTDERSAKQPPEAAETDSSADPVVKSPANPLPNARLLIESKFTGPEERAHLVYHRGVFRQWKGNAWPEFEGDGVKEVVWKYFEHAAYWTTGEKPTLVPFRPNRSKVADIMEAMEAVVYLDDSVDMPSWLSGDQTADATRFLPMANGLLQVQSRELLAPTSRFFTPYALPYSFEPSAPPPKRWLLFLNELWGEDEESKQTLQEVMGYLIVLDTSQQKIVLLVGPPRSGKGTIARVIGGLIGRHNVAGPTLASLRTNFGLQPLIDRPVAIVSDARLGGNTDQSAVTERLLSISGEDTITIDRKYKTTWTGKLPTRLVIVTNELPRLGDSSGALTSRFLVLRTLESFLGREDMGLSARLLQELPGILRWSLDGLDRLTDRGHFVQPTASKEEIRELQELASPVRAFLDECCEIAPEYSVPTKELYNRWYVWCDNSGQKPTNAQTFGRDLRAVLPRLSTTQRRVSGEQERRYKGLKLIPNGRTGARWNR